MTPSSSEEINGIQNGPAPGALLVKGQGVLLRTWWTLCYSLPN